MLHEIKNAKKYDEGIKIRWFSDEYFDLVVWYDDDDSIISFQLTYNKYNDPHAMTWKRGKGHVHEAIDEGENPGRHKQSPILLPDGEFPQDAIAEKLRRHGIKAEPELNEFILHIISSLDTEKEATNELKPYPLFIEISFTQLEKKRILYLAEDIFMPKATGDIITAKNEYELQEQIKYMVNKIRLSEPRFILLCSMIIESHNMGLLDSQEDLSIMQKTVESIEAHLNLTESSSEKLQQLLQQLNKLIPSLKTLITSKKNEEKKIESTPSKKKVHRDKSKSHIVQSSSTNKLPALNILKKSQDIYKKAAALSNKIQKKTDTWKQNSRTVPDKGSEEIINKEQLEKARLLAKKLKGKR